MQCAPLPLIETKNLVLAACAADQVESLLRDASAFEQTQNLGIVEGAIEFPAVLKKSLERLKTAGEEERPWWTPYTVILPTEKAVIGVAGYQGPPTRDGAVEIGYGIAPGYRNRGFATEVAAVLTEQALRCPQVKVVRAHTQPQKQAGTRVLEKCKFKMVGEVLDPEAGTVWRWEKTNGTKT